MGELESRRPLVALEANVTLREIEPAVYVLGLRPAPALETAGRLKKTVFTLFATMPRLVVLDLSRLTVLEPVGVDVLVNVAEWAGVSDIGLCLLVVAEPIRHELAMAGVLDLFEVQATVEEAVRTVR